MRISDWSSDVCSSDLPCVAIGGITPANARPLIEAGADFLAVSGAVWNGDEAEAVRAFAALLRDDAEAAAVVATFGNLQVGVRSEEHTSELQSLMRISYAVFCLKKKKYTTKSSNTLQTHTTTPLNDK